MKIESELESRFADAKAAPILFIGSGFSRRYCGAPDWSGLLTHFADFTKHSFNYYKSRANSYLPEAASLIADEFHTAWFSDAEFHTSVAKFADECKITSDPLKIEVANYLSQFSHVVAEADELEILKKLSLEAIITTNYDFLIESMFPDFEVYSSQDELILGESFGAGEIYKIHGSLSQPSSLVLTSEDYELFEKRNLILAAKILTLIVEHPIVFMGYSLTDKNILTILTSIISCLNPKGLNKIRNSIYIVEWDEEGEESVTSRSLRIGNVDLPYTHVTCTEFGSVFSSMASFERRFPVKLLRSLKKHVYELVESSDPTGRLTVVDINDAADLDNADYVIGVGLQARLKDIGYSGFGRNELFRFALEGGNYDSEKLLQESIPHLLKGNASCPVFRFLREAGRISQTGIKTTDLASELARRAGATLKDFQHGSYLSAKSELNSEYSSVKDLLQKYDARAAIYRLALLDKSKIDLDDLRNFLMDSRTYFEGLGGGHISNWRKLVCFYDCLAYGLHE